MSSSSVSHIVTSSKWALDAHLFLEDFVRRYPLPHAAIVTKGQHLTIGVPNIANPTLRPYVLIHSTQKVRKVLAQLVRLKDGRRKDYTEHCMALPESFAGYFEILSQDGRPVKCLESVLELCHFFPEMCLVRANCKAYVADSDGELSTLYRTRTVYDGEVLTLVGQFNLKRTVFLRCFDEHGASVYLKLNQKGKFSPIARAADAITGVHSIEQLMVAKRLPLTVRLIHGEITTPLGKLNAGGQLALQLNAVYFDDIAVVSSLHRDDIVFYAIPLRTHLRLAPAVNHEQLTVMPEFRRMVEQCDEQLGGILQRVTVCNQFEHPTSCPDTETTGTHSPPPINIDDGEIDQLYDYIRGLAPPPPKPPPRPPPIDTIPGHQKMARSSSVCRSIDRFSGGGVGGTLTSSSDERRRSKSIEKAPLGAPLSDNGGKPRRPLSMVVPPYEIQQQQCRLMMAAARYNRPPPPPIYTQNNAIYHHQHQMDAFRWHPMMMRAPPAFAPRYHRFPAAMFRP